MSIKKMIEENAERFSMAYTLAIENEDRRRVVCAANRYGDIVIPSARHFDVRMHDLILRIVGEEALKGEQGFICNYGLFLTREEAFLIAKKHGQIKTYYNELPKLFSEMLY